MNSNSNHLAEQGRACAKEEVAQAANDWQQRVLDRRRFLAISSGCVVGCLSMVRSAVAEENKTVDIGSLKDFAEDGISENFIKDGFFVIRNNGQLFAVSTTCPHKGNTLHRDTTDPGLIVCEGHGSTFDSSGNVSVGPASTGLVRLGIAVNDKGRVTVSPGTEFPPDTWSDKQSFIEVN